MNLIKRLLVYTAVPITAIVALIFSIVEFRALFAGDFLLFNNEVMGGFTYFFRGLYFLSIVILCIAIIIYKIKKRKIDVLLFSGAVSVFIGSFLSLFFYHYYVSLVIMFITLILVVITVIGLFKK